MANEYDLDYKYFQGKIELVLRDIKNFTPDEMARELARLSKTADSNVLHEAEFSEWIKIEPKDYDVIEDHGEVLIEMSDGKIGIGEFIDCRGYWRLRFNGTSKSMGNWNAKPAYWSVIQKRK